MPSDIERTSGRLILFLGAGWWGSDARSLAAALRRSGNTIIELTNEDFFPVRWSSFPLKVLRKLVRPFVVMNYNQAVMAYAGNPVIDFVLVFKGSLLRATALELFQKCGTPIYCFYPDVSFLDHGPEIPKCLSLYDCVFTTKPYHLSDPNLQSRIKQMRLVSHGYDPDVHTRVMLSDKVKSQYGCDVSFVGARSPKKEKLMRAVIRGCPDLDIRIWGPRWEFSEPIVREKWMGQGAYGDELLLVYGSSKVNLGLLSEAGAGTSVGDSVTARTLQIPAAGGFLLHEDTPELAQYFRAGIEIGVFGSEEDLPKQVRHYVGDEERRIRILEAGFVRCVKSGYTHDVTALKILQFHDQASH